MVDGVRAARNKVQSMTASASKEQEILGHIQARLPHTLTETRFPSMVTLHRGKVRDVYRTNENPQRLVIITTDRVSAFDRVLGTIPFKGEILNRMAADAFERTQDIVKNHVLAIPDPNVLIARPVKPYPIEFVVRGFITGSLWRDYETGKAGRYGLALPESLRKDQRLDAPILTPTTKAELGEHDEPISKAEIVARGLLSEAQLERAQEAVFKLFESGSERARARGLILVDTKYELGEDELGNLLLIDEVHTPDSSRYWLADEYEGRFARGESQSMLDKENLRAWLMEKHKFMGDGPAPALTDDIRIMLARRYFQAFEQMTGQPFEPAPYAFDEPNKNIAQRIENNLRIAGL